jgi:hypothetical protein
VSLKPASVERQEVLDLASLAVENAAKDGGMIAADTEAQRLLDDSPDCQIPLSELRDAIARLAIERGVAVEFGDEPPAANSR